MQNVESRKQKQSRIPGNSERLPSAFCQLPSRGFTILFAVLISSIMLTIGIAIFNITIKELRLSSVARESQRAAYAADSGAECGLYNAFKLGLFSTTTAQLFTCNGQSFTVGGLGWYATSTFTVITEGTCAVVSIAGHQLPSAQMRTIIDSRGYNSCDSADPSRIERAFRVVY